VQALRAGCTRVLIDDFSPEMRREAVRIARAAPFDGRIPLEASGSVDLAGLRAVAADGVDYVSIGALTKHVRAIDLSMKLGPAP
jgi:nicotinate-nucleotide pyrophosphorylase (carboxylating)